ncbi:histone H3.v1-like isoform X1 [Vespula pensylvanica]|uniref:histone H3.v1-like isoform X1 n=1 Tax=Vespula pensylvanica TaxID=30213 RepID=UPI001CBA1EA3|nr:histone H3.v1-like isoform X1 [Vespula pensylvanica]
MRDLTNQARLTMQDRNVDVQEGIRFRSVRRRLFQEDEEIGGGRTRDLNTGIEDNVANCFFEEVRKHREEAKKRWNFDFEKEIPLPGNYQWVKLDRDGNEIPMITEAQNKTEKMEKNKNDVEEEEEEEEEEKEEEEEEEEKKEKKREKEKDKEEEEESPEEKEVDGDDKADSRRQKDRNNSRIVDVL